MPILRMVQTGIYKTLRTRITKGLYKVGSMIPSVKQLAAQEFISRDEVEAACKRLEKEGYVDWTPPSGYVVRAMRIKKTKKTVVE